MGVVGNKEKQHAREKCADQFLVERVKNDFMCMWFTSYYFFVFNAKT